MPKQKLTKLELSYRRSMMLNMGAEVAYRLERYWAARDEGLSKSITDRREREYYKACDALVDVSTSRLPDAFLRFAAGEEAVAERDRLLGASADVVPLKRRGQPRW